MKHALTAVLLLLAAFAQAEVTSVKFHERATLTVESPNGEFTVVAVGSQEVLRDKSGRTGDGGRLVSSGLFVNSYTPPMIFELLPDRFLVCLNCTGIAARTFGITDGADFDGVRALADAAPRDTARSAHPEFRPLFLIVSAPLNFDLVDHPGRSDLDRIFGPGVKVKSYMVEITDAPVTDSTALDQMPWLCSQIDQLRIRRTDGNSAGEIAIRRSLNRLLGIANGDCG